MITLDPSAPLFATDDFIGIGRQAALDIAVDATAVKGRWLTPPPTSKPIPGQLDIGSTR
jgi:hypothetical protein